MGNESIARSLHLPLSGPPFMGDVILNEIDSCRRDKDRLTTAIHRLKEFISSAIQGCDRLDENMLVERLFSGADVDFENIGQQQEFSLSNGRTYTIRTTEAAVIKNEESYYIREQDQDVQNQGFGSASDPFLNDADFALATLCCCEEFLGWVLERIESPTYGLSRVPFPDEMVYNFIQDFSATGLILNFCKSTNRRERQSFTLPVFCDIMNLAFFNIIPNNPARGMMSIFALRQMLESWFMRIVGFRGVVPLYRFEITSGRFQKIIENGFEQNFHFPPQVRPVTFKSIQRIYQWTQASIHWAYSTNVWLLWKAMTYCERLFGATIELSALENYRTEVIKLCLEKSKFVKEAKTNIPPKERPYKRTILFRDPDIFVTDQGKRVNSYDVDVEGMSRLERNVIIRKNPKNGFDPMLA